MPTKPRFPAAIALAALLLSLAPAAAQTTKLRFTLDWKLQGIMPGTTGHRTRAILPPRSSTFSSTRAKARQRR
jgi:hypothetical protein